MSEPVRIVITMEGGLISAVCTLGVPVEALIIDYDTEGADADQIEGIAQGGGATVEACVRLEAAEPLHPEVMASVARFWPAAGIAPGEFWRCIEADYSVEVNGFSEGGWIARDPEGDEIHREPGGHSWASERAAWEACDRHRMFGEGQPFEIAPDGDTCKWKAIGVPGAMWSPPFGTREEAEADARAFGAQA